MTNVPIVLKSKYDDKGFKELKKDAKKAKKEFAGFSRGLAIGAGAVISAGALAITKKSIDAAIVQRHAEGQLAAAIKSTGGEAGLTAEEIGAMAAELQKVTNFGDEATISMQSVLLTFKNIKGDNFRRATGLILDMSERLGKDLTSSAMLAGKALNDPARGATELRRAGVQLDDQQIELIKTMQEAGDVAGAQTVLMNELETQFGGSAAAAREADGGITGMTNSAGDLQEQLGDLLLELNAPGWLESKFIQMTEGAVAYKGIVADLKDWRGAQQELNETLKDSDNILISTRATVADWFGDLPLGIGYLADLGGSVVNLAGNSEDYWEILQKQTEAAEENTAATTEQKAAYGGLSNVLSGIPDALDAVKEANEQIDEDRKKANETIRDTARELVTIDEDAYDDRIDAAKDFQKTINKIQRDEAKNIKRDNANLGRSLKKIDDDTKKAITKEQTNNQQEEKAQRMRQHVDTLGDKRLFDLDLQHMAEEGNANGIRQALERRVIEEEIAREKATVETQIEAAKQKSEVAGIKETAQERKQELQDSAALEAELRKEDLAIRIADEANYYQERQGLIEQGRVEAVAEVGAELAEMNQLTRAQLLGLVPMAGEFGAEVGASFAQGVTEGYRTVAQVGALSGGQTNNIRIDANGIGAGDMVGLLDNRVNDAMRQYNQMMNAAFRR